VSSVSSPELTYHPGTPRKATVANEELDRLRARLAARQSFCWLRLEDAASELWSLHSVPEEEIVARVRALIERERSAPDPNPEAS
jgi:hypothetical protein